MPSWRDLKDPEWWMLLVWSRIYFAMKWLDLTLRNLKS